MHVKTTPPPSSRALEEGVAIHKKARKRLDCDVANAPRNDDCGWANDMYSIALVYVTLSELRYYLEKIFYVLLDLLKFELIFI